MKGVFLALLFAAALHPAGAADPRIGRVFCWGRPVGDRVAAR